jgi:hypothetical protein
LLYVSADEGFVTLAAKLKEGKVTGLKKLSRRETKIEQNSPATHEVTLESSEMAEFLEDTAPLSTTRVYVLDDEPINTKILYVPDIVGTYETSAKLDSTGVTIAANENDDDDAMCTAKELGKGA